MKKCDYCNGTRRVQYSLKEGRVIKKCPKCTNKYKNLIGKDITYDKVSDALYIKLSKEKIVKTKRTSENIFIDLDKNENVVGIEYLNIGKLINKKVDNDK